MARKQKPRNAREQKNQKTGKFEIVIGIVYYTQTCISSNSELIYIALNVFIHRGFYIPMFYEHCVQ